MMRADALFLGKNRSCTVSCFDRIFMYTINNSYINPK